MGILPFLAKCFNRVFGCFVVVSTFFTGGHTMTTEQQAYVDSCTNELVSILSFGKRADNTIYDYRLYALPFLKFCFENLGKHPSQANEADVRAYLQHIQDERNLTDRTVNNANSAVHFLFSAVLELPWNPYKVPFRTFDEYIPFVPTKEQVEAFLAGVKDKECKAMFSVMYGTGIRVSEVLRLRFEHVSDKKHFIHITPSKRRKERTVHLPENCVVLIKEHCHALRVKTRCSFTRESFIFPSPRSVCKECSDQHLYNEIRRTEESLGWPHRFTCHTFRRAFATHNYMDGNLTLEEIQVALGHSSSSTTRIYLHRNMTALASHHPNAIDEMKF